jgi:hypothetical protein
LASRKGGGVCRRILFDNWALPVGGALFFQSPYIKNCRFEIHISVINRDGYTSTPDFQYRPAGPHNRPSVSFGSRLCENKFLETETKQ